MAKLPQSRVLPSVRRWLVAMLTRIAVVIEMSMVDSAAGRKAIVSVSTFLPLEEMEKTKLTKSRPSSLMFQGLAAAFPIWAQFVGTTFRTQRSQRM